MTANNHSLATWAATIEAVIFASEKPVRENDLRNHLPDDMELAPLITMIHKRFDETSGIELCEVGDSWVRLRSVGHAFSCLGLDLQTHATTHLLLCAALSPHCTSSSLFFLMQFQ